MSALEPHYPSQPAVVTAQAVEHIPTTSSDSIIKSVLLELTTELLAISSSSSLLVAVPTDDSDSPSLLILRNRLETGCRSPFPGFDTSNLDKQAVLKRALDAPHVTALSKDRPLGDFEDLYYAILATIKGMYGSITLRLDNKFNHPDSPLFPSCGYSISFFLEWLSNQWNILNEPSFILALDNAIRQSYTDFLFAGLIRRVQTNEKTQVRDATESHHVDDILSDMPGLSWIGAESSAMINARLNEKYRPLFEMEEKALQKGKRGARKRELMQGASKSGHKKVAREEFQRYHENRKQGTPIQTQQLLHVDGYHGAVRAYHQDPNEGHMLQQASYYPYKVQPVYKGNAYKQDYESWNLQLRQGFDVDVQGQENPQASTAMPKDLHQDMLLGIQHFPHSTSVQPLFTEPTVIGEEDREIRQQRVENYTAWLRESASNNARLSVQHQIASTQPGVNQTFFHGFQDSDAQMDTAD